MRNQFERFIVEESGGTARVILNQRGNALVNVGFGAVVAVVGFVLEGTVGTVLLVGGAAWALLAWWASSEHRVTEIEAERVVHRTSNKERTLRRDEISEVVLRVERKPRRRRKQSVLPWQVEISQQDAEKPFVSYAFQEDESARGFGEWLAEALGTTLVDRSEAAESR